MMCYLNVSVDTVQLKFIPFSLKDQGKQLTYSLSATSITNWDGVVRAFANIFL